MVFSFIIAPLPEDEESPSGIRWPSECYQTALRVRQNPMTAIGDHNVIFDTDSAPTGVVDSRFDCDDHTRFENRVALGVDRRAFMHGQSDPMPQAMLEALPLPGARDN